MAFHVEAEAEINTIVRGANEYGTHSKCVALKRITSTNGVRDYIDVQYSTSGCSSYVGRIGGNQRLKLTSSCIQEYGSIIHEFLHAVGFYHQQSTFDRDDWVTIMWENIEEGHEHNFNKYDDSSGPHRCWFPYD
ncbi:PREDICTED: zinc metalloproteinase nas-4-like [Priapulus caudatus]|uniref:Metalloendopeptidase n=1 Tax=Priapulus caudatus TaxID=37621 RepID=A0ABM1DQG7_PRICU|nr:PREDICTED: zinc metalloproteinase nas-4-like [Priapulus caudatus]